MNENIIPLEKRERVPNKARLLRKLLEFITTGRPIDFWITFPQNSCCFAFGPSKGPVPIGALFMLWSAGWPYLQKCPECHGPAYMVEFGGLLSSGGGTLICPTCENSWRQHLGDLATIAHEYLRKSPLMGTEFQPTGMLFGGAYASDGKRLLDFLGVGELPELGSGPSIEFAGQKFSMELEFEFRKLKVRRRFWLFGRKEFYE